MPLEQPLGNAFSFIQPSDNPTNSPIISNFQNDVGQVLQYFVGIYNAPQYDYSQYTSSTLTVDNLTCDSTCNAILSHQTGSYPPQNEADWSFSFEFFWKKYYNSLLNATVYQIPFYEFPLFDPHSFLDGHSNLAVRMRFFEYDLVNAPPVYSLVDVITGVERFRLFYYLTDHADKPVEWLNTSCKRVTNGVPDPNTILTFSEILEINTAIPCDVVGYDPWTALEQYYATNPNAAGKSAAQIGTFETAVLADPFVDGINGHITFGAPRLIALDKPVDALPANIFGVSWLPWNESMYYLYDQYKDEWVGIDPINTSNITTIFKLIGLGVLFYELITIFRLGKLPRISINYK